MPTILIASLQPGEGRTTAMAGLGASLANDGRTVRLLRIRSAAGPDRDAEDDARTLAAVPGCAAPPGAVSEQERQAIEERMRAIPLIAPEEIADIVVEFIRDDSLAGRAMRIVNGRSRELAESPAPAVARFGG